MKKTIIVLSVVALALTVSPAFAHDSEHGDKGGSFPNLGMKLGFLQNVPSNKFAVTGSIHSKGSNSLLIDVVSSINVDDISNGQVTIKVDSDTNYTPRKSEVLGFSDVKVGDKVMIQGMVSGDDLIARYVHVMHGERMGKAQRAFGEVTAKTSDSITLKNNLTGESKTFETNDDTKVRINGETKTIADIHVGDSGWVKFRDLIAKFVSLFR